MIAALVDHLWQSSLVVLLAWAATSLLRRNGAHLRYWVWLAASIKFLVPFSLLALVGGQLAAFETNTATYSAIGAARELAAPLITPATYIAPSAEPGFNFIGSLALAVWALGFFALAARWFSRWRMVQAILRSATPSSVTAPIPVLASATLHEPGVVGVFRPVLLLPEQLASQLDDRQLRAVLEHELCHVRRRDNLTSAIHMVVEALFWFHPFVWWMGARLIRERERACDEAVVRSGHDAQTYAEGILEICRHFVASKLICVSGVSGADLRTRVESIMKNETIVGVSRVKSLVLGTTAFALLAAPVMLGVAFSSQARAESPTEGKRIRLKYNDTEVREILKAIADTAGINMLVNTNVSGKIDVDLDEMPWQQALAIVLNATDLVKVEKDGIIFIDARGATKAQKIVWRPKSVADWRPRTMVELTRMQNSRVPGGNPDDKC
jgi:beta-lactamase regulating signal transducer with metallopeptidase domain